MTAQEVIKAFMAALNVQNYSDATSALDDAVKSSSRFNGIQEAIDTFLEDQKTVEREAIKTILGSNYKSDYDGKQLSDLLEMAKTDSSLATVLNAKSKYPYNSQCYGSSSTYTAAEQIRMLTANTFLAEYCGIDLERYYFHASSGTVTYYNNYSTGNTDTGAITGSDAGGDTTKTAKNVVPEIGNKYDASNSSYRQNISTGTNDWIVKGTNNADTITSGGADSIDAGKGWDIVYVEGEHATISAGKNNLTEDDDDYDEDYTGDYSGDTIYIKSSVKNVVVDDLEEWDVLNVEGTFELANATYDEDEDTVTIEDKSGRTIIVRNWTTSQNANIYFGDDLPTAKDISAAEGNKLGERLSNTKTLQPATA